MSPTHHIANSYIALFTNFIPAGCGGEAVLHPGRADEKPLSGPAGYAWHVCRIFSQGKSEPVFGLSRMLGVKLMPGMPG